MNESVKNYIDNFPIEVKELYSQLRTIIYDSALKEVEEKFMGKASKLLCRR